ncbi:hypothetical protein [Pseudotenacibaculum haliotis]|uniref:DUF4412 domain-containing protein n=1 Tax=Pseudotenacibaculum haliotis TaxID=1862138 RepID=A0ABW5LXM1_9FLAO
MRKIALILFLGLSIPSFASDCGISGMNFYPLHKEISLNSSFIIQGYNLSQKTVNGFKNRNVYLISSQGDSVRLSLLQILNSEMSLTQALFKPERELKPNSTYFLRYQNQTKSETREMRIWRPKKKKHEMIYWKTSNTKRLSPLDSNLEISFLKTKVIEYGCGPEANAIFSVQNKSQSEIWFKTEVLDTKTGKIKVFYTFDRKGKLNVGHGMCAGAFSFNSKTKYKVRFTPLNTDGKELPTTNWYVFNSPYDNAKNLFGRY